MSDKQKDNLKVDNWAKNAEEHGRMGAQLATLTTLVEVLTWTSEKLEDGQKEVRAELIVHTNETNKHIIELYKRIEALKTFMMSQFNLLRQEFQDKSDKQAKEFQDKTDMLSKEFQDKTDKLSKEIRTEMRWLIGALIAFMGLAFTAMALALGNCLIPQTYDITLDW